jgi:hypothetical protein
MRLTSHRLSATSTAGPLSPAKPMATPASPGPGVPTAATDALAATADSGKAEASLALMPASNRFRERFGTDQPLAPNRSPLADLLQDLKLADGPAGLLSLLQWLDPGHAGPTATALSPEAFDTLQTLVDRRVERWATEGGSFDDLRQLRSLVRFVRGETEPAWPATAGFGPTTTEAARRQVVGVDLQVPAGISEKAVQTATTIARMMLSPAVAARLQQGRALLVIVPINALSTDVAQLKGLRGLLTADGRSWDTVRGVSDVAAAGMRAVALPEENLLHDSRHDPQAATYSSVVHELAHTVLTLGVTDADRRAITTHYVEQRASGVEAFTDAYAATNVDEYFAQASCAYFGVNEGQGRDLAFLSERDPWLVAKLSEIYGPPPEAPSAAARTSRP